MNPIEFQHQAPWLNQAGAWFERTSRYWAAAFIAAFLISGVLTLPHYGMTWDEGLGNFFFGERYLHYFLTFQEKYLDFKAELDIHSQHPLNLYPSPFREVPNEFPPVADTLSAASMYLFSYRLGWLNPIDGFHLFTILLSAGFLAVLYRFASPRLGKFSAFMAVVFLGAFPRFWGDMHFNVKDVPETVFFSLTILAYLVWYEKPALPRSVLVGILWGLALGVKANAIFIPFILIGGHLLAAFIPLLRALISRPPGVPAGALVRAALSPEIRHFTRGWFHYPAAGLSALVVYIASWPYLYTNPIQNLKGYWGYIFSQGGRTGQPAWSAEPLRYVLSTMPEVMLVCLAAGLIFLAAALLACPPGEPALDTRQKAPPPLQNHRLFISVLIAWLVFPILRASIPGAVNFDGIRHFLEFLPAAALTAGWGASRLAEALARRSPAGIIPQAVILALTTASIALIYTAYFPFLHLYFNSLSGGFSGARSGWVGPEASDYWGSSYRQGMDWLRQHAPEGAKVYAMPAGWIVNLSAPVLLRPDIRPMPAEEMPDFSVLEDSPVPVYLMFNLRPGPHDDELAYAQKQKDPVYQLDLDGEPLLQIFQFGGAAP